MTESLKIAADDLIGLSCKELKDIFEKAIDIHGVGLVPDLEKLAKGNEPNIADAACNALSEIRDVSAANALFRIRESVGDKSIKKAAGHALHKLRSIRIEPGEGLNINAVNEPPRFGQVGKIESAYASYYDSSLMRFFIMGIRPPGLSLFRMIWVMSHHVGIHDSYVTRTSKREFEKWIEESKIEREGIFQINAEHAQFLADEAYKKTVELGATPQQDGIGIYLETIRNMPATKSRPIIYELLDESIVRADKSLALASEKLLDVRECAWRITDGEIEKYSEQVLEIINSVIVMSNIVREERLQKIVSDYISSEFSSDKVHTYQRMLEETAYLFFLDNRMDYAKSAFQVALLMKSGEDLYTIPFIRRLVEKSLGIIKAGSPEEEELKRRAAEEERIQLVKPITQDRFRDEMLKEIRGK